MFLNKHKLGYLRNNIYLRISVQQLENFKKISHSIQMTRLSVGRFINSMLKNLKNIRENNKIEHKLKLYSGHDTSLIPLLVALEQYPKVIGWPPFSSYIAFEVYTDDTSYFVKVVFNDQVVKLNCTDGDYCSMNEFVGKIQKYSLKEEEYKSLCDVC